MSKILLIHNFYNPKSIGGEDIVFKREYNDLLTQFGKDRIFQYCVTNSRFVLNPFFSLKHFLLVFLMIKKHNINIVHIHNTFPKLTSSVIVASKFAKAKVILTLHNYRQWCINGIFYRSKKGICQDCKVTSFNGIKHKCYKNSYVYSLISTFNNYLWKKLNIFNLIDYIFVLTNFQKEIIVKYKIDPKKIILKPNYIELINPQPNFTKKHNSYYVVVGRIEESKGILELARIWTESSFTKDKLLVIIGNGQDYFKLLEIKSPNLKILGKLDNKLVLDYIKNAKFLIQPSLWFETFGLTILESFSMGTPVLGLDIGTRKEFINGRNGYLFKDLNQLVESVNMDLDRITYKDLVENSITSALIFSKQNVLFNQIRFYNTLG
jgi:glycosyltransferase involved in cell wall biosynthesis